MIVTVFVTMVTFLFTSVQIEQTMVKYVFAHTRTRKQIQEDRVILTNLIIS